MEKMTPAESGHRPNLLRHTGRTGSNSLDTARTGFSSGHSRQDTGLRIDSVRANSMLKAPQHDDEKYLYQREKSISPIPSPSKDPDHKHWGRPPPYSAVTGYGDWRRWEWFEDGNKIRTRKRPFWHSKSIKARLAVVSIIVVFGLWAIVRTSSRRRRPHPWDKVHRQTNAQGLLVDDRDYAEDLGVRVTHEHVAPVQFRNAAERIDQGSADESEYDRAATRQQRYQRFNPNHYERRPSRHRSGSVDTRLTGRNEVISLLGDHIDRTEQEGLEDRERDDEEWESEDESEPRIETEGENTPRGHSSPSHLDNRMILLKGSIPPNMINESLVMSPEASEAERRRRAQLPRRHRFGARLQDIEGDDSDMDDYEGYVLQVPKIDQSLSNFIGTLDEQEILERERGIFDYLGLDRSQTSACGNWPQRYTQMHREVLAGSRQGNYISYVCEEGSNCGGLADRMLGITSAFLLALLTDRVFLMEWQTPASVDTFFDLRNIDWTYDPSDETHPNYNKTVVRYANELDTIHLAKEYIDKIFNETLWDVDPPRPEHPQTTKMRERAFNSPWIKYFTNRGIAIRAFRWLKVRPKLNELELKRHMVYGCIIDYLFRPKPQALDFIAQYASVFRLPSVFTIGIQIRTGDASMADEAYDRSNTVEKHEDFFNCASQIAETYAMPGQHVAYFLVTDSAHLRTDAVAKLGDKVIVSGLTIEHVHKRAGHLDGVHHAIMEEWILATTDYRIITQNSGFGKVASFTSGKEFTTISLDPVTSNSTKRHVRPNCRSEQYLRGFTHIADYWSLG